MRSWIYLFALTASIASAQNVPDNLVPDAATTAPASALPAAPGGRSTVMGGEIQKVDMVRDQLMLKVPAGHTIKILFDERTQVFQNGKKISMLDLKPEDHASVETTLDGTAIFALRIHMMTDLPDGELRGRVERFNSSTGELKLVIADTKDAVTIVTTPATPVARVGQSDFTAQKAGFADLIPGSMVDVSFKSGKSGPGAATHINVLAVPGAEFVFRGTLASLDLRAGRLSVNGESERPTDISFDASRFPAAHDLHQGEAVKVKARYDGTRYIASDISVQ